MSKRHSSIRHLVVFLAIIAVSALLLATNWAGIFGRSASAKQQKGQIDNSDPRTKVEALIDRSANPNQVNDVYDANGKLVAPRAAEAAPPSSDNLITAGTYAYSTTGGALLEDMSSGTTTLDGNNFDDQTSGLTALPFDFWFDGVRATQFSINANGEMRLGNTQIATSFTNSLASVTDAPKLAVYWDDLWIGFNGKIHYKTIGTAPNRKLVVEWQNMVVPRLTTNGNNGAATFQAWLYEGTGVIEYVYGAGMVANATNSGYSVGIQSGVATNFAAVTTATGTVSYAAANDTQTNAITAGTKYTFTPTAPTAPTGLNFTGVTGTSETLNWTDTSSNEAGFLIYRSTDGVNYTFITQTAANAITSTQNNLGNNQTYSWRVIAVSEGAVSSTLSGSQATTTGTVSGLKTVGPTGTYASLTAAFADITTNGLAGNVNLELQSTYLSAVETFPIVPSVNGSLNAQIRVLPALGATGLSITGSNATALIDLNGSSFVTIDGRPGGTGPADMTISNTNTGGPAVRFINGASNNLLESLKILGVNTASTGVVNFSTTTTVTGNNNNTIDGSDIRDGATAPLNGISSTGSTTLGLENNNNTVSNNSIFNFFSATVDHNGILLGAGNTNWSIFGNSIYNTIGPLNITTANVVWNGIQFSSATGSWGHTVTGNFIGGTAASAGGGALTFIGAGVIRATRLTTGTQISTSLQGNTITNFNLTSSGTATGGAGLGMITGAFNAGNITPNTVSNWTLNITGAGTLWRGVSVGTGTAGITLVSNNVVTNITNAATSVAQFQGIGIQGIPQVMTISGNTVGSTSVANSISMSAAAVSFFGFASSASGAASYVFSNNTIANITSTGTGAFNMVGMSISSGGYSITGNTIRNLTTASTTTASTIVGINATATSSLNQFLSQNTVRSCSSTAPAAGVVLFGIIYSGPTTGASVVSRNFIHSISAVTTSTLGEIDGIRISAGNATFQNNMIRSGFFDDATPTSMTTGLLLGGIVETGGTNSIYHNTIYIGGTGVASSNNTGAIVTTLTAGTRSIRDNILANNRQNASGTAANAGVFFLNALTLPSPAGLTMSNNVYFSFDPAGSIRNGTAGTIYSVGGWQGASAVDASSIYATLAQINFVNAEGTSTLADPFPRITSPSAVVDLHIASPTVIESSGIDVGVLDDFDGQTRASLTPVDVGADAGNFVAVDLTPPNITYTALANTASTANRVLSTTIADATGVAAGANLPRIYFKKSTDALYVSTQCVMTGGTAQNGTYDCTIDHSMVGGVVTNDIVQYFVIAQDTAGTPNVGSNPGGVVATNVNSVTTPPTPNSYTILPTLSGKKTVGAGGDYPTLTAALAAVNGSVVTGAVQLTLIDATYPSETFPLVLNANPGSSATNTITIKPLATITPTISGVSAGCVLNLNGADWTIVDGSNTVGGVTRDLTIANTGVGTTSAVICMTSTGVGAGATNNVIKNVNVAGTSVTATPTTLAGIFSGSSTISITSAGADNDSNTIQNNSITKTTYGIYSGGASAANKNTGTVISQNVMNAATPNNITTGGILVIFDDGVQITRNDIGNILKHDGTTGTTATAFGIALGVVPSNTVTTFTGSDVINGSVTRNKIDALTQLNTTGYSAFGIVINSVTSGTTLVANNMISRVISASTASDFSGGIIAGGGAGSTTQIYYNSVSMTGLRNAASFPSYGLAINSGNPIVDVRNNIFFNTQTTSSTGKSYAIANASTTFTNMTSNHNDLFATGATAFIGQTGGLGTTGTDRATLADWQAATGQDTTFAPESISADPLFTSVSDLHIPVGSPAVNAGSTIAAITTDFDGDPRPAGSAAEIGADELLDATPPETTIDTFPPNPSTSSSATFTFSGTDTRPAPEVIASFECSLDAAIFAPCTSPVNLTSLSNGSHTFQVRAKDFSGNVDPTPASYTWFLDATFPDTQILTNPPDPSNSPDATFTFSGSDTLIFSVASFECKLDAGSFAPCTSPQSYLGLADGSHNFQVHAIDTVGNVDPTPASYTWTIATGPIGPVSVTATAGTTGPTAYPTLKDAFDAINAGTHQGAITVSIVTSTTETASAVLNNSGAGAAIYTSVLVRPTAVVTVTGSIVGAVIKLNGADNVTIDGRIGGTGTSRDLTVSNSSTAAATAAIWLASVAAANGASNDVIRNLELACGATQNTSTVSTFGILMGGTTISVSAADGNDNDNNSFIANRIIRSRYGIVTRGLTTNLNFNPVVTDNIIGPAAFGADEIGKVGIFMQSDVGASVSRNTVQFIGGDFANTTAGTDRVGIALGVENWASTPGTLTSSGYAVTRNIIHDVIEERTFSAVGILLATTNGANPTNNLVANNFIYNVNANGTAGDAAVGLGIAGGNGDRAVFNSIRMSGDMDPNAAATTPTQTNVNLRIANTPTNLTVKNNSLYNDVFSSSAPALLSANIQVQTATFAFGTGGLNNNNYFFPASNTTARTGAIGTSSLATTFFATLANWQAAITPAQDAASIQADPQYLSATDLHIALASPNVNVGATGTGVTTDIDAQLRDALPDIGADEPNGTTPPANDIAATAIITPAPGSIFITGAIVSPQASFTNVGSATQTSVNVQFTITGPGGYSYTNTQSIASIAPEQVVTVTFAAAPAFTTTGAYVTGAAVTTPDSNAGNDTVSGGFTVSSPLSGTYTVGSGGDFTSLTNPGGIFDGINSLGATSNLVINITSDLTGETGAIPLNEVAGGFAVLIKPSGAARAIFGSAGVSLIKLSGADNVTIDGSLAAGTDRSLTINNSLAGVIVWIATNATSGANSNTVKNCILSGPGGFAGQGIIAGSGATFGGAAEFPNSNNTIQNNAISRVQNALFAFGNAVTLDQNWSVVDNTAGSATVADKLSFRGFLISNSQNFTISRNVISGVNSSTGTSATMSGIQISGNINGGTVSRNFIKDIRQNNTGGWGSNGIYSTVSTTASNLLIANNFISDVASQGFAGASSIDNGYGIMIDSGGGFNIYHNSVNLNSNQVAAGSITAALNIAAAVATVGSIDLRDNILVSTQTVGTRYGVYDSSTAGATVFSNINYNDYFAQNVGFLTSARATLAAWQTATGQDVNSLAVDPLFVTSPAPADLHLQVGSPMINAGALGTGVLIDIDGDVRPSGTAPEIGADEIVEGGAPGTLQFSSATYSIGEAGVMATITVTRTGGSTGTVGISYATIAGGSANGGAACGGAVDYVNTSGTLSFGDTVTSQTFDIPICNDAISEPNETVNLELTLPTGGATLGSPSMATLTINDDDGPPAGTFSIDDVRTAEGNSGTHLVTFTVSFVTPGPPPGFASVQYGTGGGTATPGAASPADYMSASGTATFGANGAKTTPDGSTTTQTQTFTVAIIGDVNKEPNETFFVQLSNPNNGTLGDALGVCIIFDEDRAYVADFDRDLKTDLSVFRPIGEQVDGVWYIKQSTNGITKYEKFGNNGDTIVPGDYDADGVTDLAVFRPSSGSWLIERSSDFGFVQVQWGLPTDLPVQGDYDGDDKTDVAVFRDGTWYVLRSSDATVQTFQWGAVGDHPVPGDYDGDGKSDFAVFRQSTGTWYVQPNTDTASRSLSWGTMGDIPVSGDFDGDGSTDIAVFRPSDGNWYISTSLTGATIAVHWGQLDDIPVVGDYDADGISDIAVWRPATGNWYILNSNDPAPPLAPDAVIPAFDHWGRDGDKPVPAGYVPEQ